jgi:hypothetical protein
MNMIHIVLLACAFSGTEFERPPAETFQLYGQSSMVTVLPDVPLQKNALESTVKFAVAGGEVEAGQIIIEPGASELQGVEFSMSELKGPSGIVLPESEVTLTVMGYVKTSPDVKVIFPFERTGWFPDPILPFVKSFDVEEGRVQSLWLSVNCPPGQQPCIYEGDVTVSPKNAEPQTIPVEVRVFGFDIPRERSLPTLMTTFIEHAERIHGDDWNKEMYWKYVDLLQAHRVDYDNFYREEEPIPTVEDVKRLVAGGQEAWCLRYLRQPGEGGSGPGADEGTYDEYVAKAISDAKASYEVFKEAGAEDLCYIYFFDEVPEEKFDMLKETAKQVRAALPGVPLFTTALDPDYGIENGVSEVMEIWATSFVTFGNDDRMAKIRKARDNGDKVMWITTVWPPRPHPNFYVEYDAIESRLFMGAMPRTHRPDGFVYWSTTWWWNNDKPISEGPYTDWNPHTGASNGDGSLICAGKDGPLTTIRFENFRDGLEDYEYYSLLKKVIEAARKRGVTDGQLKSAEALLTIPQEIVKALDDFSRDARPLEKHRLQIAEAIEELTK